jgi:hypothetical protein
MVISSKGGKATKAARLDALFLYRRSVPSLVTLHIRLDLIQIERGRNEKWYWLCHFGPRISLCGGFRTFDSKGLKFHKTRREKLLV